MQKNNLKILIITPYPIEGPSSRYRVWQYLPYFKKAGIQYQVSPLLSSKDYTVFYKKGYFFAKIKILMTGFFKRLFLLPKVPGCDVIFIQKEAFPLGTSFFERLISWFNKNILFDFDDAIYLPQTSEGNKTFFFLKSANKARKVIGRSKLIFAGNQILADYARPFNSNVTIVPTPIDTNLYFPVKQSQNKDSVIIGWMGSRTSASYLLEVEEALANLKQRFGKSVRIVIVGADTFRFQQVEAEYKPWKMETELSELHQFDIGMMPLPDNEWTRGKCGFKALLYMSVAIPPVCSAVGVNQEIISHGKNGFLIQSKSDWEPVLTNLIQDSELRKNIGSAARRRVLSHYSLEIWSEKVISYLNNL